MKGATFSRAAVLGLILVVAGAFVPIRSEDVATSGAEAVWSGDELYIFVEQNKMAWSQNLWSFSLSVIRNWMTATTPPTFHRIDCIVYRVTSTSVEEHLAKGWHVLWAIAPLNGMPHAFMGGDRNWGVYRWTGTQFEKLSPADALAAKSGYTYMDELFKREGWSEMHILPVRGTADSPLTLGGAPYLIRAAQDGEGKSRIEIVSGRDPSSTRVIYEFKNRVGLVSAAEYRRLTD